MWWLFIDTLTVANRLVVKRVEADSTISIMIHANEGTASLLRMRIANAGDLGDTPSGTLVAGEWNHHAVVFNGAGTGNAGRLQAYKNGTDQTITFVGTIPATLGDAGTAPLSIGARSDGLAAYDAKFAHIKAWTAALTAAEVAQEMNSYRPVRRANLILWAPYDDGIRARDYSGSGNHGTITGPLYTGGPPQIPRLERPLVLRKRRAHPGLWGHRILA